MSVKEKLGGIVFGKMEGDDLTVLKAIKSLSPFRMIIPELPTSVLQMTNRWPKVSFIGILGYNA